MFIKKKLTKNLTKEQMADLLRSRVGERCIYFEKETILHGLVKDCWKDDSGIFLALESLPAFGLESPLRRLNLSCGWEDFYMTPNHFHAYQPGWHLFFHRQLIERVLKTAADNTTNPNSNERFVNVMDAILVSLEVLGDE